MGVKKLRSIFMRYILLVAGGIVLMIASNIGIYFLCTSAGVILPTVQIEKEIQTATEKLQTSDIIDYRDIPFFCDYAVFTDSGKLKQSSLDNDTSNTLWNTSVVKGKSNEQPYRFAVINRDEEVLILRYRIASQFSNETLRNIIPAADLALILLVFLEIIVLLFLVSSLFGKYTGEKIKKLLMVTQRIEEQDLDFNIDKSGIFEIDQALEALEHMKQALKQSLADQWQADKLQQDQISALAHDLKTPLTIIRGNTELLSDTKLNEEQRECAEYILSSSEQMQGYIKTLIDVTKSKYNLSFQAETIDVADLLSDVKIQAKGLCAVKNIHFECKEDYATFQLSVDKEQLLRAIVNVLSNAVEYTPNGGRITFTVSDEAEFFTISVSDTGIGFSKEALKRATEQFYMGDNSRTSDAHYGIGLYIVQLIINKHNGKLILDNDTVSGGAVVTIKIPHKV